MSMKSCKTLCTQRSCTLHSLMSAVSKHRHAKVTPQTKCHSTVLSYGATCLFWGQWLLYATKTDDTKNTPTRASNRPDCRAHRDFHGVYESKNPRIVNIVLTADRRAYKGGEWAHTTKNPSHNSRKKKTTRKASVTSWKFGVLDSLTSKLMTTKFWTRAQWI